MIDVSKFDVNTLELMKEASKSRKEYVIPLISTDSIISAYDIIEGSESYVSAIDPSLIPNMVALFHNHSSEIRVIASTQDIVIFSRFNIPMIIGGKKEIKLFELKSGNTLKSDLELLVYIQDKVLENLSLEKPVDEELRNNYRSSYEKTLSNFDIRFIYLEK